MMKGLNQICLYHKATDPVNLVNLMVPEKYISRNTENRYFCLQISFARYEFSQTLFTAFAFNGCPCL